MYGLRVFNPPPLPMKNFGCAPGERCKCKSVALNVRSFQDRGHEVPPGGGGKVFWTKSVYPKRKFIYMLLAHC
jgi:hypothetical protein